MTTSYIYLDRIKAEHTTSGAGTTTLWSYTIPAAYTKACLNFEAKTDGIDTDKSGGDLCAAWMYAQGIEAESGVSGVINGDPVTIIQEQKSSAFSTTTVDVTTSGTTVTGTVTTGSTHNLQFLSHVEVFVKAIGP